MPRIFVNTSKKAQKASTRSIAKKALSKINRYERAGEKKFKDTNILSELFDSTGNIYTLNSVVQDNTESTRNGDKIYNLFINLNGTFALDPDQTANKLRVILYYDKTNDVAAASNLLEQTGTVNGVNGQYKRQTRDFWIKLFDRQFVINDFHSNVLKWHIRKKLRKDTQFEQASSTIATGAIKLMVLSDASAPSGVKPSVTFSSRVSYSDQ